MYDFESSSGRDDETEKYGAGVLDALRDGDINDQEAIKIGDIGKELHQKLNQLGKENIFSKEDQKRWKEEISRTKSQKPSDASALKHISDQIDRERSEILKLTQTYSARMEENDEAFTKDTKRGLDTKKDYLKEFMELSFEKKLERFKNLQKDIDERYATIEAILKIDPDMGPHLKTMRRSEREEKLKELEKSINKDLQPHEKLMMEYAAFPDKFRNISRTEFRKLTLQAKAVKMKEMIKAMEKDFDKELKKASSGRTKSKKDLKDAKDYFFNPTTPLLGQYGKIKAYEMFGSHLEKDQALVRKFKEAFDEFPTKSDLGPEFKEMGEKLEKDFYEGSYTEREAVLEKLEQAMDDMNKSYDENYLEELQKYQKNGIISMKTLREYSVWYRLQSLKDKPKFLNKDLPDQMTERKMVLTQFKQALSLLSPEKATLYHARFFNQEIGGSAREQVLKNLLSEQKITKEDLQVLPVNDTEMEEDSYETSPSPEKPSTANGSQNLENASDAELQKIVDQAKQAETILKKRKLITSLDLMAEAANDNALRNDQQATASKRTHGLDQDQRELQEQMNEQATNGEEMVLVNDTINGGKKAQKITKIDINKAQEKTHEQTYQWEKEATRIQQATQDKRGDLGQSIQFTNENGQAVSAKQGVEQVAKKKKELAKELAKNADHIGQERGESLSQTEKARLEKIAAQNTNVKLEADYSKAG